MKDYPHKACFGLLLVLLLAACAPVKPLGTWKDDSYSGPLGKTMILVVAREDYIRQQFENVLADKLRQRGVEAISSHKVLPERITKSDRDAVIAKVEELGVQNVLLARSINQKEIVNQQYRGPFFAPTGVYEDGWYSWYEGFMVYPQTEYQTSFFTMAVNLFTIGKNKPVWSFLSQVKVGDARQKAVNEFVPVIMQQLTTDGLVKASGKGD